MRLDSEVIAIKERSSMLALAYGRLDVEDGALVLVDVNGVRTQIPVGGLACIMLEPGTTVTHAAIALAADCGTLLLWIGEGGVRRPDRRAFPPRPAARHRAGDRRK